MLGRAMRLLRVKYSASSQLATATTMPVPSAADQVAREIGESAEKQAEPDGDEDIAEAADEAEFFVVCRFRWRGEPPVSFEMAQRLDLLAVSTPCATALSACRRR